MDLTIYNPRESFIIEIIAEAVMFAAMRQRLISTAEAITGLPADLNRHPQAFATVLWYFAERHYLDYSTLSDKYSEEFIGVFWSYEEDFNLLKFLRDKKGEYEIAEKIFLKWTQILKAEIKGDDQF